MLKKKGFTLLELVAVIIVIAIASVILTPLISKSLREAKIGAFKNSAYGLFEAAESYYGVSIAKGQEFTETRFDVKDGLMLTKDNIELLFNGSNPDLGSYVVINTMGKVQLLTIKGEWCGYKNYNDNEIKFGIMKSGVCVLGDDDIGGKDAPLLAGGNEEWITESNKITITNGEVIPDYYQYYKSTSSHVIENGEWIALDIGIKEIEIDDEGEYYIFVRGVKDHMPTSTSYPQTSKIDYKEYNIQIVQSDGGTITANKSKAKLGESVIITLTPNDGYKYEENTLKVNDGETSLSGYSFIMPRNDVTITAMFKIDKPPVSYAGAHNLTDAGNGNWLLRVTATGTLTVTRDTVVDIFLVGGGGGGANSSTNNGAGGGAGGRTRTVKALSLKAGTYTLTIGGGGGTAATGGTTSGLGYSAAGGSGASGKKGGTGGSGGGGGGWYSGASGAGGSNGGSGGNGAGAWGTESSAGSGQGSTTYSFGESSTAKLGGGTLYAGGGGGGFWGTSSNGTCNATNYAGAAGSGGGGRGGSGGGLAPTAGTNGYGGGGGGGSNCENGASHAGARGGSGAILIRNAQ